MDIYPLKICGSGYDIISKKSGYDPVLRYILLAIKVLFSYCSSITSLCNGHNAAVQPVHNLTHHLLAINKNTLQELTAWHAAEAL